MNRFLNLFQYASDLNLEKGFKRSIIPKKPFLILAGDIGYPRDIEYKNFLYSMSVYFEKIFVLSGNHEYDTCKNGNFNEIDTIIEEICTGKNNLFYLQKKLFIIEEDIYLIGCTFWSKLPKSKYGLHLDHKTWLENILKNNENKNFIIATHHCPLFECLNKNFHNFVPNYFATDQTELIKMNNLITWIHGHSHKNNDFKIYNKWILSNQYGYFKYPNKGYKF